MSEIHDAGIPACPGCGQIDQVAAVPAVWLSGRDSVSVRVPARGEQPAHTETRQVTTALARALAPAPERPASGLGCLALPLLPVGVGLYAVAAVAGEWTSAGNWTSAGDDPSLCMGEDGVPDCDRSSAGPSLLPHGAYGWLGWVAVAVFLTGAALLIAMAVRRAAFRRRVLAGRPAAEALWSRGWYCARCGTVHFRPGADVPFGTVRLGEFRRIVWGAGGYGDLVAHHPVA